MFRVSSAIGIDWICVGDEIFELGSLFAVFLSESLSLFLFLERFFLSLSFRTLVFPFSDYFRRIVGLLVDIR